MSNSIPTIEDLAFNLELYAKGHPINPHILTESASLLRKIASGEYEKPEEEIKFDFEAHKVASRQYAPVVHAHWIETKIFNPKTGNIDNGYKCSKCGLLVGTNKLKYCAKCGAITGEEEDNHGQAN